MKQHCLVQYSTVVTVVTEVELEALCVRTDYMYQGGFKLKQRVPADPWAPCRYSTCLFRAGSLGFEDIDAKTFAAWEVDYL